MKLENLDIDDKIDLDVPIPQDNKIVKDKIQKAEKKGKTFWEKVFNIKKLEKPHKVAVIYLRNNGRAEPMILEPKRGFFTINRNIYNEDKDCVYSLGKNRIPFIVIRENNLLPIGTDKWYEQSLQEIGFRVQNQIMKGIRHAEFVRSGEKDPMNISAKQMIGFGLLAVIIIAIIMNLT